MYKWFVNLHLHTAEQHPIPSTTSLTLKLSLSDGTTTFSRLSTLSNTVTTGSPHPSTTPTQPTTMSTMEAHHIITIAVTIGVLIVGCMLIAAVLGCVGGVIVFKKRRKPQKKMEEVSNVPPKNQDERIQLESVCGENSGMNCTLKIV